MTPLEHITDTIPRVEQPPDPGPSRFTVVAYQDAEAAGVTHSVEVVGFGDVRSRLVTALDRLAADFASSYAWELLRRSGSLPPAPKG